MVDKVVQVCSLEISPLCATSGGGAVGSGQGGTGMFP